MMPAFSVRIVNRNFSAREKIDAANSDEARTHALKGALEIGTDEVCQGNRFFGAEITIEGDGGHAERLLVAIVESPLQ